jgi:hypothetical protein
MITHSRAFIHIRRVRIRKAHCKAFLACGGAFLMAADAASAWAGPALFPQLVHHHEALIANGGKLGAAMAGFVPFFEGALSSLVREAA